MMDCVRVSSTRMLIGVKSSHHNIYFCLQVSETSRTRNSEYSKSDIDHVGCNIVYNH